MLLRLLLDMTLAVGGGGGGGSDEGRPPSAKTAFPTPRCLPFLCAFSSSPATDNPLDDVEKDPKRSFGWGISYPQKGKKMGHSSQWSLGGMPRRVAPQIEELIFIPHSTAA
jgi:hypothetical protein